MLSFLKASIHPVLTVVIAGGILTFVVAHPVQAKIRMYGGPIPSAPGSRYYPPGGQGTVVWNSNRTTHRAAKQVFNTPSGLPRALQTYVSWESVPLFSARSNYLIPYTVGDFSKSAENAASM